MRKILLKLKGVLLGTLLVVCLCSCGKDTAYYVNLTESETETKQDITEPGQADNQTRSIYVYVCGQIQNPGVYTLAEGSRVCDLFVLAGGFTKDAAKDYWNQARLLKDGEMIYVPTKEEVKDYQFDGENRSNAQTDDPDKVNINTASMEELMTLPGIGETRAMAILSYRKEHGSFSSLEELKQVEGIKDGVFSKMKDYIEI